MYRIIDGRGTGKTTTAKIMARAVNGEARGEPYEGQVAVAAVILNRVKHSSFPNSIAGVIYQPGAFTAVDDGQIDAAMTSSCERSSTPQSRETL